MKNHNIKSYPLKSISLAEAMEWQFKIVEKIASFLPGQMSLSLGDLGVKQPLNQPDLTNKVEQIVASIFNTEAAILVTGAGTGALRWSIFACLDKNRHVLVHDAPIYPTTKTSLKSANVKITKVDFNDLNALAKELRNNLTLDLVIVQQTRQKLTDHYQFEDVIKTIKQENPQLKIITDDNYGVFKTGEIGTTFEADLATFSGFKILGPEGIGVIVGKKELIAKIRQENYSGGSQVQSWQAMALIRAMVYAPVALAIQAQVIEESFQALKDLNHQAIANVYITSMQSKTITIEFKKPIARKVLIEAEKLGALPHPVGAESKYELTPLFYRVSGTMRAQNPHAEDFFIRINPNRAGAKLVLKILLESIAKTIN